MAELLDKVEKNLDTVLTEIAEAAEKSGTLQGRERLLKVSEECTIHWKQD